MQRIRKWGVLQTLLCWSVSGLCVICKVGFEHFLWKAACSAEISPGLGPSPMTRWHIIVLPSVLHAIYFWELDSGTLGNACIFLLMMSPATDVAQVISVFLLYTFSLVFSSAPT